MYELQSTICIFSQLYSFFISYIFQFVQLSALSFINVSARIFSPKTTVFFLRVIVLV